MTYSCPLSKNSNTIPTSAPFLANLGTPSLKHLQQRYDHKRERMRWTSTYLHIQKQYNDLFKYEITVLINIFGYLWCSTHFKIKKPILFDSVFRAESNGTTHILRKCLWTEIWSLENVKIIVGSKLNFYFHKNKIQK